MTSSEIRQSFLDFFREKQHTIVPSSSLLPDSPNLLFTNAGMNQFVPIFLGQQIAPYQPPRVVDTQKCIRAGGKHNDLDDVGLDTYHHTFFEMLGNWSFGDYFKKEAIEWAWELVVRRWGFPAQRLYATVYQPGPNEPSEFDQEAHDHWARLFREADLDPAVHIVNGGKKDNFWMMGDTGPCGPCSELHVDLTAAGDTRGSLVNAGDPRCIEIWNLVFIRFNANSDGSFSPLPQRHIDTGMGFERVTAMIQGTKNFTDFTGTISNYETDIFRPIFDEIEKVTGKKYGSTLPGRVGVPPAVSGVSPDIPSASRQDASNGGQDAHPTREQIDIAFRVIADHIRTLSFAIADGIQPSNEGRGYVLRRILRRAVRYGRTLGFHEPFFFKLVEVVARTMGNVFPELRSEQKTISATLRREEDAFNRTLDRGIELFEREVALFPGSARFQRATSGILPDASSSGTSYTKRRLPHYERPHGIYHVTFTTRERRILSPAARTIVLNAFRHFDQKRYDLFAVCVMPDHVHVLLQPWIKGQDEAEHAIFWPVGELMHSVKSFTANRINELENRVGDPVWEKESHDRLMRSDDDVAEKFNYIAGNAWRSAVAEPTENYEWVWTWEDRARENAGAEVRSDRQDADHGTLEACAPQTEEERREISGAFAFRLYDEQGFPLDLTELMARERGLTVDVAGFEKLMEEQRLRGRAAQKKEVIEVSDIETKGPTNFLGYEHYHTGADVTDVLSVKNKVAIILNNSVCYAEMGGQVGDTGQIIGPERSWQITNTQRANKAHLHFLDGGDAPAVGEHVTVRIDEPRRLAIERHHTVTHLLHWALHEIVARDAAQKGSYVGPEKLTFDFSSAALTKQQMREVESLVNDKITENSPVSWTEIPYTEAKQRADIVQFFGDKYGEVVRVVQIGGQPNELNGYSMELCGGTHVHTAGDIGYFRILNESAIAAGIRRIEAIAGDVVGEWAQAEAARQDERFQALAKKKPEVAPLPEFRKSDHAAMVEAIETRAAHLEKIEGEVRDWEKAAAKSAGAELQKRATEIAASLLKSHGGQKYLVTEIPGADGALLQAVADAIKSQFSGPIFLAGSSDGRVDLLAAVPKDLTGKFQAGALIQKIAPIVGGKGGGRPDSARGAGKDSSKLREALSHAKSLLEQ